MAAWRCPHCGTLQVESGACFLCDRSATSCGTCVNFRRSLVGGVGYCALDSRREPLAGDERRPCWTDQPAELPGLGLFADTMPPSADGAPAPLAQAPAGPPVAGRRLRELRPQPPLSGR